MAKKKSLDRPQKVRTTLEELEVLSNLKNTVEWAIVKRIAARYVSKVKTTSFNLKEFDAQELSVRHADFAGQAFGIKQLIRIIDDSGKRAEKMEGKK